MERIRRNSDTASYYRNGETPSYYGSGSISRNRYNYNNNRNGALNPTFTFSEEGTAYPSNGDIRSVGRISGDTRSQEVISRNIPESVPDIESIEAESDYESVASKSSPVRNFLKRYLLIILLTAALVIGLILGISLRYHNLTDREKMYLAFPGDLLIRMLKVVVIPLITSSLIVGIANIPEKSTKRMSFVTSVYFLLTSTCAVVIGLILVTSIGPGYKGDAGETDRQKHRDGGTVSDAILDLMRNLFPANIIEACFVTEVSSVVAYNTTNDTTVPSNSTESPYDKKPNVDKIDGSNILGLMLFSIVFGILLGQLGEAGDTVRLFFQGIMTIMTKFVMLIIWYSPIGIVFILASRIVNMDDPSVEFYKLGHYTGTVLGGLALQAIVVQPLLYFIVLRKNPLFHVWHCLQALLTALATASSAATLPVTMHCLEDVAKVNKYVVRFVAPVGGTINMDGTAINLVVAVVFIGQVKGENIDAATIVIIGVTGLLASIATAGIPEGSIFSMIMILQAAKFDIDGWSLIYTVDWFLDRCRTTTNVWGDCVCSRVVERFCQNQLHEIEQEPMELQTVRVTVL